MLRGIVASGRLTVAGLVAVVGSLLAGAPVSAQAPPRDGTVFVHSAKSGKLGGGRLTLLGVGPRVTWTHESGRSGVMAVKGMHRMLFTSTTPEATATLHGAGYRGGDEPTFKLSQPRYNRARHSVGYKAKPLNNKALPGRAARAAATARTFGAASLTSKALRSLRCWSSRPPTPARATRAPPAGVTLRRPACRREAR